MNLSSSISSSSSGTVSGGGSLRFGRKLLWTAPFFLFVAAVNVYVDPAGIFHRGEERQIAAYLLDGYNVANVYNHDDRRGLAYYAEGLRASKDVLVFGSSRTMVIDSQFFPGEKLFNASLTAATLRDVVAAYELFHERGFIPRKAVIGVEPYMFNGMYDNRLYLEDALGRACVRLGLPVPGATPVWMRAIDLRYFQILAPAYFQASMHDLAKVIALGRPKPYPTTDFEADTQMARADGSLNYAVRRRARDAEEIRRKAERFTARNPEELSNFRVLDPGLCHMFEVFVNSLLEEGVEVIFLKAPYHPIAYKMLNENPAFQCVAKASAYFDSYAARHNIRVYGSYAATECGATEDDFYDAVHSSREALLRVWQAGPKGP